MYKLSHGAEHSCASARMTCCLHSPCYFRCSWRPASGSSVPPAMPNVTLSSWTFRSTYLPGHGSPPGQNGPLVLPTLAGSGGAGTVWVSRSAVPVGVQSPMPIAAGLAASVSGLPSSAVVGTASIAQPGTPTGSELAFSAVDIAVAQHGELTLLLCFY